ncbi:unnamed protein product [Ceratitis capitata]|uniref:(Mediterranean fruit fly) hypothetical protein n=1 Tax=Ceratitis capitata TaxID=7213 RepID=A0A811V353_CERCA|nr:unnamed protein product [Ceratitis capitata]
MANLDNCHPSSSSWPQVTTVDGQGSDNGITSRRTIGVEQHGGRKTLLSAFEVHEICVCKSLLVHGVLPHIANVIECDIRKVESRNCFRISQTQTANSSQHTQQKSSPTIVRVAYVSVPNSTAAGVRLDLSSELFLGI